MSKYCINCDKEIYKQEKFCSRRCLGDYRSKTGYRPPSRTGISPWNKGLKGFRSGEKNNKWSGDYPTYPALHKWVVLRLGKAFWCTWCFSCVNVQWANISHTYKRDLGDWMQLCRHCHELYDKGHRGSAARLYKDSPYGFLERRVA
jgi:hypothetical protein